MEFTMKEKKMFKFFRVIRSKAKISKISSFFRFVFRSKSKAEAEKKINDEAKETVNEMKK